MESCLGAEACATACARGVDAWRPLPCREASVATHVVSPRTRGSAGMPRAAGPMPTGGWRAVLGGCVSRPAMVLISGAGEGGAARGRPH
jgi:hypothetical protein